MTSSIKKMVISSHVRGTGPSSFLEDYAKINFYKLLSIEHPLILEDSNVSSYRLYREGQLLKEHQRKLLQNKILARVQQLHLTLFWSMKEIGRVNLFIGVNTFNCTAGLILRFFSLNKRVIFYSIDWSPKRFKNKILNGLFHTLDRSSALLADESWNVSKEIISERWNLKYLFLLKNYALKKSIVLPIGLSNHFRIKELPQRHKHRLVFLGHLIEKQGLQLVIEALPEVLKIFPDTELNIIGSGPFSGYLEKLTLNLGISSSVNFLGYVEESKLPSVLTSSSIGIATYLNLNDSFTKFADPGKLKNYLASGLSILLTDVPPNAQELEMLGFAVIVKDNTEAVKKGLVQMLSEPHDEGESRRLQELEFVSLMFWDKIFNAALSKYVN